MTVFLILLGAVCLQWAAGCYYEKNWWKHLLVQIAFQEKSIREGEKGHLKETIENRKWLLLPVLQAAFHVQRNLSFGEEENTSVSDFAYKRDIFSVFSYQRIQRTIEFQAEKRGYYEILQTDLLTRGLLLGKKLYQTVPCETHIYVYPKRLPAQQTDVPFQKLMGQVLSRRRMFEDPFSFRGLREYDRNDPMNKINWKATARTGALMVNLQDSTTSSRVFFLLDIEDETIWKYEKLHETGISIVGSLGEQFLARGVEVGLFSNGRDHITGEEIRLMPGSGEGQLVKICQSLARLDLEKPARKFSALLTERKRELEEWQGAAVLITKNQGKDLYDSMKGLADQGISVLWIVTLHPDMEWKLPAAGSMEMFRWEVEP